VERKVTDDGVEDLAVQVAQAVAQPRRGAWGDAIQGDVLRREGDSGGVHVRQDHAGVGIAGGEGDAYGAVAGAKVEDGAGVAQAFVLLAGQHVEKQARAGADREMREDAGGGAEDKVAPQQVRLDQEDAVRRFVGSGRREGVTIATGRVVLGSLVVFYGTVRVDGDDQP
jgi:hypothetical protein